MMHNSSVSALGSLGDLPVSANPSCFQRFGDDAIEQIKRRTHLRRGALTLPCVAGASSGHGATVNHFSAAYANGAMNFNCTGEHVFNKGPGGQDDETCLLSGDTTGLVAGTYTNDLNNQYGSTVGVLAPWGDVVWTSDYYSTPTNASSWTICIANNGDGTFTMDIDAFYANMSS